MKLKGIRKRNHLINIIILLFYFINSALCNNNKPNFTNYTVNNGLSNNYIDCVFMDHKGWIWIGTRTGIERFDGIKFKEYNLFINDTTPKEGLLIRQFYQDNNDILYACFEEYGLAYYNRQLDRFESMKMIDSVLINNATSKDVIQDNNNNLWIATKEGVLKYNPDNHTIKSFTKNSHKIQSLSDNYVRKVSIDKKGILWIGTFEGLDYLDTETEKIIHYSEKYPGLQDDILDIWVDDKDRKWIGTSNYGIFIIDSNNIDIRSYVPDKQNQRSYKVNVICQKSDGNFWIGTRGGLYIYSERNHITRHYVNNELENNSLVHNSILNIMEDNKGDIWIGTRGGISHFSQEKQAFIHYKSIPNNNNYMNNSEIYCVWIDPDENVWLGTEKGGVNILNPKTGKFEYLTSSSKKGLSSNCIKKIINLDNSNVLIGTFQGGLNIYNLKTKKTIWLQHDPTDIKSISSDIVWDIAKDRNNRIWVSTSHGLDLFDIDNFTFSHINEFNNARAVSWIVIDSENDLWLGYDDIIIFRPDKGIIGSVKLKARSVFEDSKNRFWIATEEMGLVLCDKNKGIIKEYNEDSGIASKLIYRIEEDNNGKLWISTANGLSFFDPDEEKFRNFEMHDGLQSNQFYYGASYKDKKGELYFGGINGLTVFDPKDIVKNQYIPPVYLTNLKIFNESVNIDKNKKTILKKSISETKEIHIPYNLNVITLEFAALNYTNSQKNSYKYMLEGFDNGWIVPVANRSASYTNLNPGTYTFKVIASNNNNVWNKKGAILKIVIDPAFYMTIWFKIIVLSVIVILVLLVFRFILNRRELKRQLEFEKERAKNLHELDVFKLKLFTNISHEIRTPLTLIISPLKKLIQQKNINSEALESIKIMERNAQHLLKLVTQLLDQRKLQEGKLQIELKRGDIVSFCNSIFISFKEIMDEKNISYSFKSVQDEINANFDPDKLKHILNNIISNAIKYNKPSGHIDFFMHLVIESKNTNKKVNDRFIKIVIEDTGIGINQKDLEKIFARYFSNASSGDITSTGIGLAFAKELIELHEGKIYVESSEGKGSKFTLMLPLIDDSVAKQMNKSDQQISTKDFIQSKEFEIEQQNKKIILVIDDNIDILTFIKSHFKKEYLIFTSENGIEGYEIATEAIPDIIISDIMLPDIDGRELCKNLKKDERTSHIPVILLSALSSKENILTGFEKGADDYISKPFDIMVLQKKVENILKSREAIKEKYSRQITLVPTNNKVTTPDEKFLKKVLNFIEKNIDVPDLDIEKFAREMGVSRMQLYRKISALTHMTVKECITDIRLKRAAQILSQNKLNISDVAYSVGFNDLSYFGKCFKNKFGSSPTEYMNKNMANVKQDQ